MTELKPKYMWHVSVQNLIKANKKCIFYAHYNITTKKCMCVVVGVKF